MRRLLSISILLLGLSGCGDDEPKRNVRLGDLWPHENGQMWSYQLAQTRWSTGLVDTHYVYADSADVPPPPSLAQIRAWLDQRTRPAPLDSAKSQWILHFNGERTTLSGMLAQRLEDSIVVQVASPGGPSGPAARVATFYPPVFLRGGAWKSNDSWIGLYGDIDRNPSWRFLDKDLRAGASFSLNLPGESHGRLTGWITVNGNAAPTTNLLVAPAPATLVECVYLLDFGVQNYGTVFRDTPWRRDLLYGRVLYMPGIGPIDLLERSWVQAGDPDGYGHGESRAELVWVDPPPRH